MSSVQTSTPSHLLNSLGLSQKYLNSDRSRQFLAVGLPCQSLNVRAPGSTLIIKEPQLDTMTVVLERQRMQKQFKNFGSGVEKPPQVKSSRRVDSPFATHIENYAPARAYHNNMLPLCNEQTSLAGEISIKPSHRRRRHSPSHRTKSTPSADTSSSTLLDESDSLPYVLPPEFEEWRCAAGEEVCLRTERKLVEAGLSRDEDQRAILNSAKSLFVDDATVWPLKISQYYLGRIPHISDHISREMVPDTAKRRKLASHLSADWHTSAIRLAGRIFESIQRTMAARAAS
ncbi:hypothetical protein B0H10DRAFT_2242924 [Mycena sp. CBHHK59/15]|nr:hypothetical protein B0H10DRAFT_2242924 [Mycena sp. CBHHK59/15]